ncbi:MAG: hypothetical protein JW847_02995 [Candidatus Omnitrophica bacterium]|nr:hypothetical protein [Candidatus Omnitrophota bacterium]
MEIMKSVFNLKELLGHFKDIGEHRYGLVFDYEKYEDAFYKIKTGQIKLSKEHIKIFSEDSAFPIWWKIPEINNSELDKINNILANIKPYDLNQVWGLVEIFKNIGIVSCILCVTDPNNYAIYSVPVENLLNITGTDQVERYLDYLKALKEIGNEYKIERIADVDRALWTLTNIINNDNIRNNSVYKTFYQDYVGFPNIIKKIAAKNLLKQILHLAEFQLDLAFYMYEQNEILAGIIASRVFEITIKQMCKKNYIKLIYKTDRGPRWLNMPEIVSKLLCKKAITQKESKEIEIYGDLRNKLVHGNQLDKQDLCNIKNMINWLYKMMGEYKIDIKTKSDV